MPATMDSLWSPEIKPTTQSPRSILDAQARAITEQTNGLLVGELRVSRDEKQVYLTLDLVVPALDNYRHRILTATHALNMMYPVRIEADFFAPSLGTLLSGGLSTIASAMAALHDRRPRDKAENEAASDEEFRILVGRILKSHGVTAIAQSLVAQANEALAARDKAIGQSETTQRQETAPGVNGSSDESA